MANITKIIATIGPASERDDQLVPICQAVDILRFNLKHNSPQWHEQIIERSKNICKKLDKNILIMIDIPRNDMPIEVNNWDLAALSYVKNSRDIAKLKEKLKSKGKSQVVVAKIETKTAIEDLDNICQVADGIMVARGDLGQAIEETKLNIWQKRIIETARSRAIPVIVATEMLMSMCQNDTPTRAEVADVANAIFDGTDGLMLSNETAIGQYPAKAAMTLQKIAADNEGSSYERQLTPIQSNPSISFLAAAAQLAKGQDIEAVIVFSKSGQSALILAGFRPGVKIIGVSNNKEAVFKMGLAKGVEPVLAPIEDDQVFDVKNNIFSDMKKKGVIMEGKNYLVIHGQNWLTTGSISSMRLTRFD